MIDLRPMAREANPNYSTTNEYLFAKKALDTIMIPHLSFDDEGDLIFQIPSKEIPSIFMQRTSKKTGKTRNENVHLVVPETDLEFFIDSKRDNFECLYGEVSTEWTTHVEDDMLPPHFRKIRDHSQFGFRFIKGQRFVKFNEFKGTLYYRVTFDSAARGTSYVTREDVEYQHEEARRRINAMTEKEQAEMKALDLRLANAKHRHIK